MIGLVHLDDSGTCFELEAFAAVTVGEDHRGGTDVHLISGMIINTGMSISEVIDKMTDVMVQDSAADLPTYIMLNEQTVVWVDAIAMMLEEATYASPTVKEPAGTRVQLMDGTVIDTDLSVQQVLDLIEGKEE